MSTEQAPSKFVHSGFDTSREEIRKLLINPEINFPVPQNSMKSKYYVFHDWDRYEPRSLDAVVCVHYDPSTGRIMEEYEASVCGKKFERNIRLFKYQDGTNDVGNLYTGINTIQRVVFVYTSDSLWRKRSLDDVFVEIIEEKPLESWEESVSYSLIEQREYKKESDGVWLEKCRTTATPFGPVTYVRSTSNKNQLLRYRSKDGSENKAEKNAPEMIDTTFISL